MAEQHKTKTDALGPLLQPLLIALLSGVFLTLPVWKQARSNEQGPPSAPSTSGEDSTPHTNGGQEGTVQMGPTPWTSPTQLELLKVLDFDRKRDKCSSDVQDTLHRGGRPLPCSLTHEREIIDGFAWSWFKYVVAAVDPLSRQDCNRSAGADDDTTDWCRPPPDGFPQRRLDYFPRWMTWKALDSARENRCERVKNAPRNGPTKEFPDPETLLPLLSRVSCADADNASLLKAECLCDGSCMDQQVVFPPDEQRHHRNNSSSDRVLLDRWGAPVQFEVRTNPSWQIPQVQGMFSFPHGSGRGESLADMDYLANPAPISTSAKETGGQKHVVPAVAMKLAWKVLHRNDDRSRFFVQRKVTLDGEGFSEHHPCSTGKDTPCTVDLGLIGVHLTLKFDNFSDWVWVTFEQVDVVPESANTDRSWLFFDKERMDQDPSLVVNEPTKDKSPPQIVRSTPLPPATELLNDKQRAELSALGSVWQHYRLVGTQYRSWFASYWSNASEETRASFEPDANEDPQGVESYRSGINSGISPRLLRNAVLEPFHPASSSCLGCHRQGAKDAEDAPPEDFTFQDLSVCLYTP